MNTPSAPCLLPQETIEVDTLFDGVDLTLSLSKAQVRVPCGGSTPRSWWSCLDAHGSHFADELDRRDYATGELWKNELPFRLTLNRTASDDNAWHCKHYAGRGEKSFYKSGAALAEDVGMPVSKVWESIEAQIHRIEIG